MFAQKPKNKLKFYYCLSVEKLKTQEFITTQITCTQLELDQDQTLI